MTLSKGCCSSSHQFHLGFSDIQFDVRFVVSGIGEHLPSSFPERFSGSNVVRRGQTVANAEVSANQESISHQAGPPNTDGNGLLPASLPPLCINTERVTDGFGIRSRSWHEEVGFHCPTLHMLVAVPQQLVLVVQIF